MTERALQEQIPHNNCFGCGPHNSGGLNLKSYWSGKGASVARFTPESHHCAGPPHFVNGGIIATLMDCHSICTATAAAYFGEDRAIGSVPRRYFATAALTVRYLRPTPLGGELVIEAEIAHKTEKGYRVVCRLMANDKVCVAGEVEAAEVFESWIGGG